MAVTVHPPGLVQRVRCDDPLPKVWDPNFQPDSVVEITKEFGWTFELEHLTKSQVTIWEGDEGRRALKELTGFQLEQVWEQAKRLWGEIPREISGLIQHEAARRWWPPAEELGTIEEAAGW